METKRKQYTPEFKLKVVLESLQRETTLEEVRTKFGVSTSLIHRWRQEFQAKAADIFVDKRNPKQKASRARIRKRIGHGSLVCVQTQCFSS